MTDCDRSPNLLSRDACYTLGVLKPCYTVERAPSAQQHLVPKPLPHQKMKGSGRRLSNNSRKQSISQSQLKDCPLMKQDILHVYSDVFTGIGKFPGMPYKFQLKENVKPARHAPRKVPIHLIGTVYPNIPLSSASLHVHPRSSLGATVGVRMSMTAYGNLSTVSSVWPIGTSRLNLRPCPLSI